ncbi:MAG: T9SS type A sorting domain-containing protein, partial [Bacteroidota bacterium]
IFPNPAEESFTIVADGLFSFELYDAGGAKLFSVYNQHGSYDGSLAGLPKGVYYLKITARQGQLTEKLVRN